MIGLRTSFFTLRHGIFLIAAAADVFTRIVAATTGWEAIGYVADAGRVTGASIGADGAGVAAPMVGIALMLTVAAYAAAQATAKAAPYLRGVSATLLIGSLLCYGPAAGMSALLAFLAYGILLSGWVDAHEAGTLRVDTGRA